MNYAVCALIVNKDNKILAVSRKDNHSDWGFPGGKIEEGETFREALIREVLEETGYHVEPSDQLNYFEAKDGDTIVRTYLTKIFSKSLLDLNPAETGLIEYRNKEDLLNSSFGAYNKDCFLHFTI